MKENHLLGTHLYLKIIHLGLFIYILLYSSRKEEEKQCPSDKIINIQHISIIITCQELHKHVPIPLVYCSYSGRQVFLVPLSES